MILGFVLLGLAGDAGAQVYRCGNTYTAEPCKGGKEVDVSPAFSDRSGPKTKEIYLCRAPQGGLYWTVEHCGQRGWTIEERSAFLRTFHGKISSQQHAAIKPMLKPL